MRAKDRARYDIHDRVNYAVVDSSLTLDKLERSVTLNLTIDTEITQIMDYFEIFLTRMNLCKLAAKKLQASFKLIINGLELI